jgi:hypothetical protein
MDNQELSKRKLYERDYYIKNKEAINKKNNDNYQKNKEKIKIKSQTEEFKKRTNLVKNKRRKVRRREDPVYRLREIWHVQISKAIKGSKENSCFTYLPYTIDQLKLHIESQFEPWMNWDNQGVYNVNTWDDNDQSTWRWQVDHIIPQSHFPYNSLTHPNLQKCWALENLRPLSAKQNILENDRRPMTGDQSSHK